jgi:hypothetical protein
MQQQQLTGGSQLVGRRRLVVEGWTSVVGRAHSGWSETRERLRLGRVRRERAGGRRERARTKRKKEEKKAELSGQDEDAEHLDGAHHDWPDRGWAEPGAGWPGLALPGLAWPAPWGAAYRYLYLTGRPCSGQAYRVLAALGDGGGGLSRFLAPRRAPQAVSEVDVQVRPSSPHPIRVSVAPGVDMGDLGTSRERFHAHHHRHKLRSYD